MSAVLQAIRTRAQILASIALAMPCLGALLDPEILTLRFARRFTGHRRLDLIVMGRYRHTALLAVLLGSTVDRVLRQTQLPVLMA